MYSLLWPYSFIIHLSKLVTKSFSEISCQSSFCYLYSYMVASCKIYLWSFPDIYCFFLCFRQHRLFSSPVNCRKFLAIPSGDMRYVSNGYQITATVADGMMLRECFMSGRYRRFCIEKQLITVRTQTLIWLAWINEFARSLGVWENILVNRIVFWRRITSFF